MAPFNRFELGFYLAEPLMVIIAVYTLFSVVLIGRGVFCGWLCPFGALQELLGQIAKALRVPQWNPSVALEQRLWMGQVHRGRGRAGARDHGDRSRGRDRSRSSRSRPRSPRNSRAPGRMSSMPARCSRSGCSPSAPIAASSVRSAACSRRSTGCISQSAQAPARMRQSRAVCANARVRCGRSCRPARSSPPECFQCLDCQVEYFDDKRCPPLVQRGQAAQRAAR